MMMTTETTDKASEDTTRNTHQLRNDALRVLYEQIITGAEHEDSGRLTALAACVKAVSDSYV